MIKFDIASAIQGLKSKDISGVPARVLQQAQTDITAATLNEVPVVTGRLRDSYFSTIVNNALTFGYTADYALEVHERLGATFSKGKTKFLEDPVRDYEAVFISNTISAINEVVK